MTSFSTTPFNDLCEQFLQVTPIAAQLASVRHLRLALRAAADDVDLVEAAFERVYTDLVEVINDPPTFDVASDALTRLYDAWLALTHGPHSLLGQR